MIEVKIIELILLAVVCVQLGLLLGLAIRIK